VYAPRRASAARLQLPAVTGSRSSRRLLALMLDDAADAGDGGALPAWLRRPRPGRSMGDPLPGEQRNASRERNADE
jgi:hypothetical protein